MKTAVGAPAPRPTDEEMLDGVARLTLHDLAYFIPRFRDLIERRLGVRLVWRVPDEFRSKPFR